MKKKILIRSVNWLGDLVMSLPAITKLISSLKKDYIIDVLADKKLKEIFEFFPGIGQVLTFSKKKGLKDLSSKIELIKLIRQQNYDYCVVFPNSFNSVFIPYLAGINNIAGFDLNFRGWMLSKKIDPPQDFFAEHHALHYLDIVSQLSFCHIDNKLDEQESHFLKIADKEKIICKKNLIQKYPFLEGRKIIAIAPGAEYGPAKKWPERKYIELTDKIVNILGYAVILLGTQKDVKDCERIKAKNSLAVNMAGKTSIRDLVIMLAICEGIVCNDSGAMHLAASLNIKVSALFGSTAPSATRAIGQVKLFYKNKECSPCFKRTCKYEHYHCLEEISVDEVFSFIKTW